MDSMSPTPAEIAARLSEAQKEALASAMGGDGLYVTRWKHGRSVAALHRMGLTNAPPRGGRRDGIIAILTPLGLAVRAQLLGEG